ncbi:MAG: trypsin-like serine protease [Moraxellaceae bacterium]|nr:trypsin-like serine protease [Moraxellaceae bacterium]
MAQGSLHNPQQITPSMMCAESMNEQNRSDTCGGDSGSGLIIYNNFLSPYCWVNQLGNGCAQQGYGCLYTACCF